MKTPFGHILRVDNVNQALPLGMKLVQEHGVRSESRGMATLRVPGPVMTVYDKPMQRVLFDPIRNANPFFHLMEALWIIAGSNRVELPKLFLDKIDRFSDNGLTFHGAYGYRLRRKGWFDQLEAAIDLLVSKPDTRQCVLSIWDPQLDLGNTSKDIPCNDMIMLDIVDGALNMTVCNRSNDIIWGAYGANAVQFSMLQEYIAASIGVAVGKYVQQSNNYHVYLDNPTWIKFREGEYTHGHISNPYMVRSCLTNPLAISPLEAVAVYNDCVMLCERAESRVDLNEGGWSSQFFRVVVQPMIKAHQFYRTGLYPLADDLLSKYPYDWCLAGAEWIQRREQNVITVGAPR